MANITSFRPVKVAKVAPVSGAVGMAAHWKLQCPRKRTRFPPSRRAHKLAYVNICECPIVQDQHGSSGRWQDIFVGAKRPETKHDWEAQCETRCSVNGTDVLWLAGGWRWFSTFQMGSTGMSKRLGPWGWRMSFMLHVVHHVDVRMVVPYRPWGSRWDYHILCRIIVGSWNSDLSLIAPQNKHARDRHHHGCWIYTLAYFFWPLWSLCPARDALTWHNIRESALGLTYFHEDGCIIGSLSMKCPPSQVCMSDPRRAPSSTAEVAKPFHQVALSLLGQSAASKSLFACAKCCVFMCLNFRHRTSCTSLKPAFRWLSPEMFLMGCLFYGTYRVRVSARFTGRFWTGMGNDEGQKNNTHPILIPSCSAQNAQDPMESQRRWINMEGRMAFQKSSIKACQRCDPLPFSLLTVILPILYVFIQF